MHRNAAPLVPRVAHIGGLHVIPIVAPIVMGLILASALLGHAAGGGAATPEGAETGAGASAFGLLPPVKIASCDEYPEDGTIRVKLVDRRGKLFLCGIDGGCGSSIVSRRQPASRPRHLFVGATYSARPGWKFLPLWGEKERSLLQLLASAIADSISGAQTNLLNGASAGNLTDPHGFEFLRLVGGVERRRRMVEAVSHGEVAPAPDAFAYFGLRGPLAVQRIVLDRLGRLSSIAISDTAGVDLAVSVEGPEAPARIALSLDLGRVCHNLRVPSGGYEERYLLTVLSTALRASGERVSAGLEGSTPKVDPQALKAAVTTVERRKDHILEKDQLG